MKKEIIFENNGPMNRIDFEYDIYRNKGKIRLFISNGTKENAKILINLLKENTIESNWCCSGIYFVEVKKSMDLRRVIDILYNEKLINISDRSDAEAHIRNLEKKIETNSKIKHEISAAQKNIIYKFFGKLYISDIFENFPNINAALSALDHAFEWLTFPQHLRANLNYSKFNTEHINDEIMEELISNIKALRKCYFGEAEIESALEQSGNGIPDIQLQREALIYATKKTILQKFPDLTNTKKFLIFMDLNEKIIANPFMTYRESFINKSHLKWRGVFLVEDFLKIILCTLKETNLSIIDLDINVRFGLIDALKNAMNLLNNIENPKLTDNELNAIHGMYQDFMSEMESQHNNQLNERGNSINRITLFKEHSKASYHSVLNEIQQYSKNISSGNYLGSQGIFSQKIEAIDRRNKCAEAAEFRMNRNNN